MKQEILWKLMLKAIYRKMVLNFGKLRESIWSYQGENWGELGNKRSNAVVTARFSMATEANDAEEREPAYVCI